MPRHMTRITCGATVCLAMLHRPAQPVRCVGTERRRPVSGALRRVPRRRRRSRPGARRAADDVGRARARGPRERRDALDGQPHVDRRAARPRPVRDRQVAVGARSDDDAAATGHVYDGRAVRQPVECELERLGRQHEQHALSGRRGRRADRRSGSTAESEMGVRLPRRSRRQRAAVHRRRDACSSAAQAATCTRSTRRPAASAGSSRRKAPCAAR